MSLPSVFIDGHAGTVGLRIHDALAGRDDLELLALSERQRKDPAARREFANRADLVVLCLTDPADRRPESMAPARVRGAEGSQRGLLRRRRQPPTPLDLMAVYDMGAEGTELNAGPELIANLHKFLERRTEVSA